MCSTDDKLAELCFAFTFLARLVAYIAVLALLVFIVFAILRYLDNSEDESPAEREPVVTETTPIQLFKPPQSTYGTCEEDIETGSCGSSSSEELYDGKICVICYDEERNCYFVPCGHCATCYDCAQRIFDGETRACPVCRRPVRKVRKWFTS
ncbi:E3 ubiquitin-protein ligase APD2-like [Syzygium oleosum]|uniref:E3 ubiquitin-protein ligase APD2-like n=1 Tax=Syzygium oleosum TaxID=219896 RepID=UPI0011D1959D|nr:E3 ubiquitin-protein ligase APD2-like [Syzygium oleosum]XP_030455783.1 E3 ubiquitin-protein ligase APD2-like [Syzygium oleosum]XP_056161169.1 E3 ubiquitin-protein ligase APD2-like [Syzygium oleosum]XP_056161170.1 E3 ubiquitin-protein ligase APD2-like [Syzygium oleosum]XP_056161171.1 E3 ubiquitin-protein ligase APD2-like [Syzygium oleosum]XP_056161172.1 E3 ubiquitin-protein ligase APD2-like [Syzygium oleosum]XP_056163856.1 E3 ubiquitin-protein ligase APD2-like [Syzygium oleosum]XP_05616385